MYVGLENPTSPRLHHLRLCRGGGDLVELELTGAGLDLLGGTALPELVAAVEPEDQAGDADDGEDDEDRHGRGLALVQSVVAVAAAAVRCAGDGRRGDRVRPVHCDFVDIKLGRGHVQNSRREDTAVAELRVRSVDIERFLERCRRWGDQGVEQRLGDGLRRLQNGRAGRPVVNGHVEVDDRTSGYGPRMYGVYTIIPFVQTVEIHGHDVVDLDRRRAQDVRDDDAKLRH
mmetsp:Transcript_12139/g.36337  ORF Transcript_12139/g.36337 Transcript_12139/m.36337 type:complete len:230 (+) Transcript_12139:287-976(+)